MFTGIIESLGKIVALRPSGQGRRVAIEAGISLDGTRIGDSIAVSGACLTAVRLEGKRFEADVSPETLKRSTFGRAAIGERVNLERALRLSDRLDGHLVSGHVDGTAILKGRETAGNAVVLTFQVPPPLTRHMIEKGSVAVDGVSLTINALGPDWFQVMVIPHTASLTTLGFKPEGEAVNIETDMLGKYVEKFMQHRREDAEGRQGSALTMEFLAKSGFL